MDASLIQQHQKPAGRNEQCLSQYKQLQLTELHYRLIPDFENLSSCALSLWMP